MKRVIKALALATLVGSAQAALAAGPSGTFDHTFLPDYSALEARSGPAGTHYVAIAAGAEAKLATAQSVMIDEPEVLISADSPYKGAKPDDLLAIANVMRDAVKASLAGNYAAVDQPGDGVLYVRLALTDLSLKKKKRPVLAYLPAGAVIKAGTDAMKGMMDKYDILNVTIQAELIDSASNTSLVSLVAQRGDPAKKERIEFEQLQSTMGDFGTLLRCRLDNARLPAAQQADCLKPAAAASKP